MAKEDQERIDFIFPVFEKGVEYQFKTMPKSISKVSASF